MLTFDSTKRLNTRLDELHSRLEGVLTTLHRLETEWMDTKDQVRKSYQRLEAAARRAEPDSPPPSHRPTGHRGRSSEPRPLLEENA